MDELELLKKDWKKQEKNLPHIEANEIYPILLKKSSSIVKWIFFISIGELALGILLSVLFADNKFWHQLEEIHLKRSYVILYILSCGISLFFIYKFYMRYKAISVTDSAYQLMKNILKTRRIVKYYIIYMLVSSGVIGFITFIFGLLYGHESQTIRDQINWTKAIGIGLIIIIIFLLIVWGIYSLLYGILLKKLKRNYKELKRLEL